MTEVIRNISKRNYAKADKFVSGYNGPNIQGVVNPEKLGGKRKLKADPIPKEKRVFAKTKRPKKIVGVYAINQAVSFNGESFAVVGIVKALRETLYTIRLLGGVREIKSVKASSLSRSSLKPGKRANDSFSEFPVNEKIKDVRVA